MLPVALSQPVTFTANAAADITRRLACDTTFGCTISTPAGETILKVYSTSNAIGLNATAKGDTGEGVTEVLPVGVVVNGKGVAGEVDITTTIKTYRVAVVAVADRVSRHLAFEYPPPPPPVRSDARALPAVIPPVESGEYADLDPAKLDFGYSSSGKISCVAVFAILPNIQLWCRLPDSVTDDPVAYFKDMPVNIRRVAEHYLAIDGTDTPMTLIWADGSRTEIVRTHE